MHTPATQTCPAAHARPHPPQLEIDDVTSTSHPLLGAPSQSANPAAQTPTAHSPPVHLAVAFAVRQSEPHAPQLSASPPTSTSHPVAAAPSQSAKPPAQTTLQPPSRHDALVLGPPRHARVQVPQWRVSLVSLASQPFASIASQSPHPGVHAATEQRPISHAAVAFDSAQRRPHPLQFDGSAARFASHPSSTAPLQSAKPGSHVNPQVPLAPSHDVVA